MCVLQIYYDGSRKVDLPAVYDLLNSRQSKYLVVDLVVKEHSSVSTRLSINFVWLYFGGKLVEGVTCF